MTYATLSPANSRGGKTAKFSTTTLEASSDEQLALLPEENMNAIVESAPPAVDWCKKCLSQPDVPCPSCAARRRKVSRLYWETHMTPAEIAQNMRISELKVLRLIEEEDDRQKIRAYAKTSSPNAPVRALFEIWTTYDERNTIAELARLAGFDCPTHVKRMLGYKPTSGTVKNEKQYPGRIVTTIGTDNAERLVRAMGKSPIEIEEL